MNNWVMLGGSMLGTQKQLPTKIEEISKVLEQYNIHSLLIIGGFEVLHLF